MRIRKSGVIRTSFIASALAMLFPLSALGQHSGEAAQLNFNNVLDKKHFAAPGGRGDILAGEPFNALVSLGAEF